MKVECTNELKSFVEMMLIEIVLVNVKVMEELRGSYTYLSIKF